ncbi:hypothetical protein [Cellulomonas sp. ICMP 17802]|uniref:hypothetical protein n=1 Tax=Cellulomonas sp. ICMP 17802 TaxID=3239199 RepID=UPI00351ABB4C
MPTAVTAPPVLRRPVAGGPRALAVRAAACAVGVVVVWSVLLLRSHGGLSGAPAIAAAVVLALVVPTSRRLPRRILLATGLCAAIVPPLWWWPWPSADHGRASVLLAVLAGALATGALWAGPRAMPGRVRAAVPQWRRVDLVVAAAGAAGAWIALPWLRLRTGADALASLLPAWDSSAHVDMALMLRRHGATIGALGAAPGGEHWKFSEYPQGFHAVVATGIELLNGTGRATVPSEVLAYAHVQGLAIVGLAVVLAAAVCALPSAVHRPATTLVMATFVVSAFVLGPGATAWRDGFPNFVVACALGACVVLLATSLPRPLMPLHLLALAGLVVGVAQTWVPLLCVAAPAAAVVAVPPRARAWAASRREVVLSVIAAVVVVGGLVQTARVLTSLTPGQVLSTDGAITATNRPLLGPLVLGALVLTVLLRHGQRGRTAWLAAVPLVGVATAAVVAVVQVQETGAPSYYFWKLVTGIALVCTAVVAAAVVGSPRHLTGGALLRTRRGWSGAAVAAAVLCATQMFGFTGLGRGIYPTVTNSAGTAEQLLAAAATMDSLGAARGSFLTSDTMNPINAQQWVLSLSGRWTAEANEAAWLLVDDAATTDRLPTAAARVLQQPGTVVVADPNDAARLRASPELAGFGDRIVESTPIS